MPKNGLKAAGGMRAAVEAEQSKTRQEVDALTSRTAELEKRTDKK